MSRRGDIWLALSKDPYLFFKRCLKIRVKTDSGIQMLPFEPNREQRAVIDWVLHCIENKKPVRVIINKCRRLGMSTAIEAIGYWLCTFNPNLFALVIAQLDQATREIAGIARNFKNNLDPQFARMFPHSLPKSRGNTLEWSSDVEGVTWGSKFRSITQGSTEANRGGDPSFIHISELAAWDHLRRSTTAEAQLTSTLASMLSESFTFVLIESTAKGASGSHYNRFKSAWRDWTESPDHAIWRPFFFSWQGVPKYTTGISEDEARLHDEMLALWEQGDVLRSTSKSKKENTFHNKARLIAKDELRYWHRTDGWAWLDRCFEYGLTPSEMRWGLNKRQEFGDLDEFDQEFPLSWQMSFIASGSRAIDQRVISEWAAKPLPDGFKQFREFVDVDDEIQPGGTGLEWQMYKKPVPGHEYIIGTDSAMGSKDGDWSAARVYDRHAKEIVAELYSKYSPEFLGEQAVLAAKYYNRAFISPEANNHGYSTISHIVNTMGYRQMQLRRPGKAIRPGKDASQIYGTIIGSYNKARIIDELRRRIREKAYTEHSRRFCHECTTYVRTQSGRYDHMPGEHDDLIDCTALIFEADNRMRPVLEVSDNLTKAKEMNDIAPRGGRRRGVRPQKRFYRGGGR